MARLRAKLHLEEIKKRQDNCSHAKGGKFLQVGPLDYAIWDHTFPDETRTVRCLICSKEWKGEELKSPEVQKMLESTTNTRTASEVPLWIKDQKEPQSAPPGSDKVYWNPFANWDKLFKFLLHRERPEWWKRNGPDNLSQ